MVVNLKLILAQTRFLLKQKAAVFTFYILLTIILVNFVSNVLAFQGSDIVYMYHPMKLLSLSYNKVYHSGDLTLLLIQLYPLLVVCPAGFSLAKERRTGQDILISSRLGNTSYHLSKLMAVILTTAIVFSAPFLIEILLNCLSFPLTAQGDLSNRDVYNSVYINSVKNYLLCELYLFSPYIYAILGTFLFGILSGLIAGFTVALSSIFKVKYLVSLFLPSFLLLNASIFIVPMFSDKLALEWYHYLFLFDDVPKCPLFIGIVALTLLFCSLLVILWGGKRDCIK